MNPRTRRHFLKLLGAGGICAPTFAWAGAHLGELRGDRVGWARLKTPSTQWKRHAIADPILTKFFRAQTTLNIDMTWYVADADNLRELCRYPLLYSQGVAAITGPTGRSNIAEYIRRGGFVLVDGCHDSGVTPDFDAFVRQQIAFYAAVLPEAKIVALPATHDIYRCHFQIPAGQPPRTYMAGVYDARQAAHGLYGVMIGSRLAGLIGVCGWQCGWDHVEYPGVQPAEMDVLCMRMVVNIYIYAMLQGH
jgi:hypothetical protein